MGILGTLQGILYRVPAATSIPEPLNPKPDPDPLNLAGMAFGQKRRDPAWRCPDLGAKTR